MKDEESLKELIENAVLSMTSAADNEGFRWMLPAGQNAIVLSPTGHLAVVHDKALREWLETMTVAKFARERAHCQILADRAEIARLRTALAAASADLAGSADARAVMVRTAIDIVRAAGPRARRSPPRATR